MSANIGPVAQGQGKEMLEDERNTSPGHRGGESSREVQRQRRHHIMETKSAVISVRSALEVAKIILTSIFVVY